MYTLLAQQKFFKILLSQLFSSCLVLIEIGIIHLKVLLYSLIFSKNYMGPLSYLIHLLSCLPFRLRSKFCIISKIPFYDFTMQEELVQLQKRVINRIEYRYLQTIINWKNKLKSIHKLTSRENYQCVFVFTIFTLAEFFSDIFGKLSHIR